VTAPHDSPATRLAVETAFASVSLALQHQGRVLLPRLDLSARRGAALHPALRDLLAQAGATPSAIGEVLVDVGPGSYTGLRVGLAMVRTLAELVPLRIRRLFSTDLIAWRGRSRLLPGQRAVVCLDARRGQWFVASYALENDGLQRAADPSCVREADLAAATAGAALCLTAVDAPPLDLPCVALGAPDAAELFAVEGLDEIEPEPAPRYLMPPL
jgi:tRNA threonylcarbamoyladenosine biosynthesis protein TsaB